MKICSNCQTVCDDLAAYCPNCGGQVAGTAPAQQPQYRAEAPDSYFSDPANESAATSGFVLGIVSLVLSQLPVASIAAIICGAIGAKKGKIGMNSRKKVFGLLGKIFSIVGLCLGIFFTVFYIFYFTVIVYLVNNGISS